MAAVEVFFMLNLRELIREFLYELLEEIPNLFRWHCWYLDIDIT